MRQNRYTQGIITTYYGGRLEYKNYRVNHTIRVPRVRLISETGHQHGIVDIREAQRLANEAELDLVEVAPNARPPVCKILNFGKYKFEQEKRSRASRKHNKTSKLKEIRMQPKIAQHDLDFKTKHIEEFLKAGNKVKVTIRFRGREMAYTSQGNVVLEKIMGMLDNKFHLDKAPNMEGRFMSMIVSPQAKK